MTSNILLNHLKNILGEHVESDIVAYIKGMKHKDDLDEFLDSIMDPSNPSHVTSYQSICGILFGNSQNAKLNQAKTSHAINQQRAESTANRHSRMAAKNKKKFGDINSFKEKSKKGQGRTVCDCEGQIHEFMNNCLNCGRIHCIEEGPGPCLFCSKPVTFMGEELHLPSSASSTIMKQGENKVFDDDKDYFKAPSNRPKNTSKKITLALDFASRKVIESTEEDVKIRETLHNNVKKHLSNVDKLYKNLQKQTAKETAAADKSNDLVELLISMRHRKPAGVENLGTEDSKPVMVDYGTVCDEEIIANMDLGLCLSMHQPYASLLVAGVKKHEGRSWKTNHRGRLWIAAAAKTPEEDDIAEVEDFYRSYYNDNTLKFPRDYPVSCVLGSVNIDDCLDQETYRKYYPNGESNSPYVFICSQPIILPIFYPIVGQNKIYPLDKQLHNTLKLSIGYAECGMD